MTPDASNNRAKSINNIFLFTLNPKILRIPLIVFCKIVGRYLKILTKILTKIKPQKQ